MFEKVLVPLDGSRLSAKAIDYAVEVAKRFSSEILLLEVIEPVNPIIPPVMPGGTDAGLTASPIAIQNAVKAAQIEEKADVKQAKRYLSSKVRQLEAKGVKSSSHIVMGVPADMILAFGKKNKIGLVIMTTSGKSGLKRALMGSVADKIIRDPGFPVLVIRR